MISSGSCVDTREGTGSAGFGVATKPAKRPVHVPVKGPVHVTTMPVMELDLSDPAWPPSRRRDRSACQRREGEGTLDQPDLTWPSSRQRDRSACRKMRIEGRRETSYGAMKDTTTETMQVFAYGMTQGKGQRESRYSAITNE